MQNLRFCDFTIHPPPSLQCVKGSAATSNTAGNYLVEG